MTREEKIQFLTDVKNGVPVKYALMRNKIVFLIRHEGEYDYWLHDGTLISKEEKKELEKYCKHVFECVVCRGAREIAEKVKRMKKNKSHNCCLP